MKDPTRRVARWLVTLGEYCFTAVYREGKLIVVPDALSMLPSANVKLPSVTSAGTGSLAINDFREEDYLETGFQFQVVPLPEGVTISSISDRPCVVTGSFSLTLDSFPINVYPMSVAATRTGLIITLYQETCPVAQVPRHPRLQPTL